MDWLRIGKGLVLDCLLGWLGIGIRLARDWLRIDQGLTEDWLKIGFLVLGKDWLPIDSGLALSGSWVA